LKQHLAHHSGSAGKKDSFGHGVERGDNDISGSNFIPDYLKVNFGFHVFQSADSKAIILLLVEWRIFLCQSMNSAETSERTCRFKKSFRTSNNKAYELSCQTSTYVCPHGFDVHH
jgi:hypothetical protein